MPLGRIARPRGPRQAADLVVRSAWAVVQLARLIRRHRIDLVHANNTISQLWAGPAARLMSVPCIWHWRDFHDNPPLNRLLARCASASIAISAGVFDFARSQIGTNGRVCLIRNGAADRWQLPEHRGQDPGSHGAWRDPWGIRPEHVMVAMLGQLVPRKGHEVLLRALASAVRCAPSLRLVFGYPDLDGDAPARVEEFRTLAERLGCGGHVTFVGFARDVPELLRDADLVVVPSWREPFGRVAVEAMLAECPVIASRVDGLAEIVLDGETGVLVPPGDADRLSAALVDLAAQPDLRHRMGRKGRQRALECFTIDRVADEVVGQYLRCRRNAR
jgi:glycosyltransferase involved in cell wall biosynthesis